MAKLTLADTPINKTAGGAVGEEYFSAVVRTVETNDYPVPSFPTSSPLFSDVLDEVNKCIPDNLLRTFIQLKNRLCSWYTLNKGELLPIFYMDAEALATKQCEHHSAYLSDAYLLGLEPRTTPGVNVGGMSAEEAQQHVLGNVSSLLCHIITHREMICLEAILMRSFIMSSLQRERIALLMMWVLLCLRLSPSFGTCSSFYTEICDVVSLCAGACSTTDEVENGRELSEDELGVRWNILFRSIMLIRNDWKGVEEPAEGVSSSRTDKPHASSSAEQGAVEAGRRLYEFYIDSGDEGDRNAASRGTCQEHGSVCRGRFCVRS